jgi:hypothetical protein
LSVAGASWHPEQQRVGRRPRGPVVALETEGAAATVAKPVQLQSRFNGIIPVSESGSGGAYLVSSGGYWGGGVKLVVWDGMRLDAKDVMVLEPRLKPETMPTLIRLGNRLFIHFEERVENAKALEEAVKRGRGVSYVRNYLAQLDVDASGATRLGAAINIPGRPVAVFGSDHLVTEDERFMDYQNKEVKYGDHVYPQEDLVTERYFVSLRVEAGKAVLVDSVRADELRAEAMKEAGNGFVFLESPEERSYRPFRGRGFMPPFRRHYGQAETRLAGLSFDADKFFKRELKAIRGLELTGNLTLAFVSSHPEHPGTFVGLLTNGRLAQVVTWTATEMTPRVVPVEALNEQLSRTEPRTVFEMPSNGYWGFGSEGNIHFSADNLSLEIPGGLSGVCQVYLTAKKPPVPLK